MGDIFSGIGQMFGGNTKSGVSYQADPYTSGTQSNLGQFFSALQTPSGQSAGGTALPAYSSQPYQGQLTTLGPYYDTASKMFEGAVSQYDPSRYNSIMSGYQDIANTGMMPQYQQYLDATTKASTNQWNQNVMPQVAEQARGFGSGSILPESITKAGQNYNTALAGQMAPYAMQAANQTAQNKLQGLQGMYNTAGQQNMQGFQASQDTNTLANYFQQLQQAGLTANQNLYNQNAYAMLPNALQFTGQSKGGYYGNTTQPSTMNRVFGGLGTSFNDIDLGSMMSMFGAQQNQTPSYGSSGGSGNGQGGYGTMANLGAIMGMM